MNIRLQLAKDKAKEVAEMAVPPVHLDITPSVLISMGIDLEEQQ